MFAFLRNTLLVLGLLTYISEARAQNFDEYRWTVYDTTHGDLGSMNARHIITDIHGKIWVSDASRALNVYDGKKWEHIALPYDKNEMGAAEITAMQDGRIAVAGAYNLLLYAPDEKKWHRQNTPAGEQITKICAAADGTLVLGTRNGGEKSALYTWKNGVYTTIRDSLYDVFGFALMKNNDVLVSCRNGTYQMLYKGNGKYKLKPNKTNNFAYYHSKMDNEGTWWHTTYTDLYVHKATKDGELYILDSLNESIYYNYNGTWRYVAHALHMMNDSMPIMGTQFGAHIAIFKKDTTQNYSLPMNEIFDGIAGITTDKENNIWIATWNHGVYVFSHKDNKKHKEMDKIQSKPKQKTEPNQQQPEPSYDRGYGLHDD